MAKPRSPVMPKACIFCGGAPLTGEHLWPEWFSKLIPKKTNNHRRWVPIIRHYFEPELHTVILPVTSKKRAGDFASRRYRVVCKECNETWMSRIEEAAIPIMRPLILGEETTLSGKEQAALVHWITLKTIVGEYDDPRTASISTSAKEHFFKTQQPYGNWKIWIGFYNGVEWYARYKHYGSILAPEHLAKNSLTRPTLFNTQATTFVGGHLYIHVFSTGMPGDIVYGFKGQTGALLRQIWPSDGSLISWPLPNVVTDDDANFIGEVFYLWGHPRAGQ